MKPLYDTSIKIFISPSSILYLQEVVLIHLKKCVFYIIYELKLPLRFSLRHSHPTLFSFGGSQPMISLDSYMSSSCMTRNTQAFGAPPYFVIWSPGTRGVILGLLFCSGSHLTKYIPGNIQVQYIFHIGAVSDG